MRRTEFHYCSRRSANGEVIKENVIRIGSEESQQEGLIWPLHEGTDGAFACIRYDGAGIRAISQ